MWCDVPWGLHSPGPTPSPYPRRVSAVVPPSGSSEKVLSAPARAHASPDVHSDRARSGASQAAQGPRTGSVVRRGFGYWYEAPDADSKYPTQTPRCACATHGALDLHARCPHHAPSKRPPLSQTRSKSHQRLTDFRSTLAAHTPFNVQSSNYRDITSPAMCSQEKNRSDRLPQERHAPHVSRHGVIDDLH